MQPSDHMITMILQIRAQTSHRTDLTDPRSNLPSCRSYRSALKPPIVQILQIHAQTSHPIDHTDPRSQILRTLSQVVTSQIY